MSEEKGIIIFDGVCNLCNNWVQFVIANDKANFFQFGNLQSDNSKKLIGAHPAHEIDLDSMVYIEKGKIYYKSKAALMILRKLDAPWFLLSLFIFLPQKLRDQVYDLVAKNRYNWFGKKKSCLIPGPETADRFID
ncbi:UNVERIFIED_CONTAM: hypothetical protein GTU68_005378 [Idotea baltica]|nr:hypothetical protein [Idotea baltica]